MIKIAGGATRSFIVPTDLATTLNFFQETHQLLNLLPHIELVSAGEEGEFRVRYATRELGSYDFVMLCDVHVTLDTAAARFTIEPVDRLPAIQPEATLNAASARGYYACSMRFNEAVGVGTQIDYDVHLRCNLPTPRGLRLMPGRVISRIAQSITNGRIKEIADGWNTNLMAAIQQVVTLEEEV